jgi:hypothetical protein
MLNMAVNVHLVPVTGLTLPMVSMGGSSIWFTSIAIGIILSVSKYVDEMEGTKKKAGKRKVEKQEKGVMATDVAPEVQEEEEEEINEEQLNDAGSKVFIQTGKRGAAAGLKTA